MMSSEYFVSVLELDNIPRPVPSYIGRLCQYYDIVIFRNCVIDTGFAKYRVEDPLSNFMAYSNISVEKKKGDQVPVIHDCILPVTETHDRFYLPFTDDKPYYKCLNAYTDLYIHPNRTAKCDGMYISSKYLSCDREVYIPYRDVLLYYNGNMCVMDTYEMSGLDYMSKCFQHTIDKKFKVLDFTHLAKHLISRSIQDEHLPEVLQCVKSIKYIEKPDNDVHICSILQGVYASNASV